MRGRTVGDLEQHEAFLRAIFDAPEDDTARLVYADYLQEHGDEDRAAFVRLDCAADRATDEVKRAELLTERAALVQKQPKHPWPWSNTDTERGFPLPPNPIDLGESWQEDIEGLRRVVVWRRPEWFGARAVRVIRPPRLTPDLLEELFALPFLQQVTDWNLAGYVVDFTVEREPEHHSDFDYLPRTSGFQTYPTVTASAVNALAHSREARRIVSLDLRHNKLDNKTARTLARSPYLKSLKRFELSEGNDIGSRVWQKVVERFGEDVVS